MDGPGHRVTNVRSVAVGWSFGCLIGDDGIVKCWGSSDHGRLGDGTTVSRPDPTPVRW